MTSLAAIQALVAQVKRESNEPRAGQLVVLVDGQRLAELMIDHEVGVSSRPVRIPKLDSDYFEA